MTQPEVPHVKQGPWVMLHERSRRDRSLAALREPSANVVQSIEQIPADGAAAVERAWNALKFTRDVVRSLTIDSETRLALEGDCLSIKNALDRTRIELDARGEGRSGVFTLLSYLYAQGQATDLQLLENLADPSTQELAATVKSVLQHKTEGVEPAAAIAVPSELINACLAGQCVLFAGPGINARTGLPTTHGIAGGLLENVEMPEPTRALLAGVLASGDANAVIEGVVEAGDEVAHRALQYLRHVFAETAVLRHPLCDQLSSIRFSGVVTTNIDNSLDDTFQAKSSTLDDASQLLQALTRNEFFLLKLFGGLENSNVVLTLPRYRDAVVRNQPFGQTLKALFHSRTLLFAGSDLRTVEEFLDSVPSRSDSPPPHFALVPTNEIGWSVRETSLRRRFGLQIIPYDPVAGGGLDGAFESLAQAVRTGRHTDASSALSSRPQTRLAKVTLLNIGPFAHLELQLNDHWNVLLGDNGMGKSSILKAIAAAIAGEDATPYASRLIKAGKSHASVHLTTTAGENYVLEILKSESGVFLHSIPVRPLGKEGWLALAFPPLRSVSWERAEAYEGLAETRPVSGDLLPLCVGETDPRLDRLKSWLLWLDHNITTAKLQGSSDGDLHYRRLRDEFYRVVSLATPGMTLKPGTVDAKTRQVHVITDDGELPIEAVSQGTQSLMGWIGVVLQRLFEVYRTDEDPTRRHAIVLMDEIDAHMHPRWQHTLVGTLTEIFPNVQFIATSHSPLVISGLKKEDVLIFRRDPEQGIRVDHPPADPKGWRVDQILTSLAFGLEGSRDPQTVRDIKRLTRLSAEGGASNADELAELSRQLDVRLPTPLESEHARRAFELMEEFAQGRLASLTADDRAKVLDEIKVQLQEGITGSRRPM